MDYPFKSAYKLAQQMRKLRAETEQNCYSEYNPNADSQRAELVRVIDWAAFNEVINQLELLHNDKYVYLKK
jgi:hypothetical protein